MMDRGRLPLHDPRQDPRFVKALRALEEAVQCQRLGQTEEADRLYAKLIKKNPDYFDALNLYGVFNYQNGKLQKAFELLKKAARINPRSVNALNNVGVVLSHLKRFQEALDTFDSAFALDPNNPQTLNNRGNAYADLKRPDDALISFESAIKLQPNFYYAYINRGRVLLQLRRHKDALADYDRALALAPLDATVHNNRGGVLKKLRRLQEALGSYDKAISLKPGYAEAWAGRGSIVFELKRYDEALAAYDKALSVKPDLAEAWMGRGNVCSYFKRHDDAFAAYDKARALKPDLPEVEGARLHAKLHLCDWSGFSAECAQLASSIRKGIAASAPFAFLSVPSSSAEQLQCAKLVNQMECPPSDEPIWQGERYDHSAIRVAYLSGDFRDHPVSYLMANVFERHDRKAFETIAISFGPNNRSEMRTRLQSAFDQFIDVENQSDADVARLLRTLEIDIAVDLMGYTKESRGAILAHRPAPIQVNYLGYPGTMGASYIDYLIADPTLVPQSRQGDYTEKIVYLPNSYMPHDEISRAISNRTFSRAEFGLPETGFVFCCFNHTYKLNPGVFEIWMRVLKQVHGSVLWLSDANATAVGNLRKGAIAAGVDPDRLVFANRLPSSGDHLARHRLADLFLDTFPYNAHTTASDALWAGPPVLTQIGETFAGRVAASLLNSIGLSELIAQTPKDYEKMAIELACNPEKSAATKAKLAQNRVVKPLFNTQVFTRHIESAYAAMYERFRKGLPPDHIHVPQ